MSARPGPERMTLKPAELAAKLDSLSDYIAGVGYGGVGRELHAIANQIEGIEAPDVTIAPLEAKLAEWRIEMIEALLEAKP